MLARGVVILATELLQRLASSLGNQEGGQAAQKHEQRVNLQHMVHPGSRIVRGGAVGPERGDGALADDGANLARCRGDTVGRRAVARGEDLTGNDEGGSVGT